MGGGLLVAEWVQRSGACGAAVEVLGGAIGSEWNGEGREGVGG